jgi:hypothetical protein
LIGELVARPCEGGGTREDRSSRIKCMREVIKARCAAVKADKTQRYTKTGLAQLLSILAGRF